LHEKEIGSWFSLALPIKTTAGFSLAAGIIRGMKRGSLPVNRDEAEEKSFARELTRICTKGNSGCL
jgi:hypothetical protein